MALQTCFTTSWELLIQGKFVILYDSSSRSKTNHRTIIEGTFQCRVWTFKEQGQKLKLKIRGKNKLGQELCQAQFRGLAKTVSWRLYCFCIYCIKNLKSSSVNKEFDKRLRLSSNYSNIEVVFHLPKNWGRLPFTKILRSSSICQSNWQD